MNKKMLILIVGCFLLWGLSSQAVNPQGVKFEKEGTPFKDILALSAKTGKPIMIDFYTEWCGWCKKLDKDTYSDPKVGEFSTRFINIKVDAEKGEGVELAKKYHVRGYPTVVFVDSTGKEIDRIVGYRPPEKFLKIMKSYYEGMDTYSDLQAKYKKYPKDVEVVFNWARKLEEHDQFDEAQKVFEEVLALDPQNVYGKTDSAYYALAILALRSENNDEAIRHFTKIINDYPDFESVEEVYYNLAMTYEREGRYSQSINVLEKALQEIPNTKRRGIFLYTLARDYRELGNYEKAVESLKEIRPNELPESTVNEALVRNYVRMGETDKGVALLRKTYELVKDDVRELQRLVWLCVDERINLSEATAWVERALELSPGDDQILYTSAKLYTLKGDYGKSLAALKKISDKFPKDVVEQAFAKNYLCMGNEELAILHLRRSYDEVKDNAARLNSLAWFCVKEKVNVEQAIGWAQRAVELSNRKGYILDTLAELYALDENYQKAIDLEKEALEKTTNEKYKEEFSEKIQKWEQALKQGEQK